MRRVMPIASSGRASAAVRPVGALGRLTQALTVQPHIVVLQFGGNDRSAGIPPDVTRANLRKMVDRFKSGGTRVIVASRASLLTTSSKKAKLMSSIFWRDCVRRACCFPMGHIPRRKGTGSL
jgi:hypothetical protein